MNDPEEVLERPALTGTLELARAALSSPEPSPAAETASRRQLEELMQEAALTPRALHEAAAALPVRPSWWERLLFWWKQ